MKIQFWLLIFICPFCIFPEVFCNFDCCHGNFASGGDIWVLRLYGNDDRYSVRSSCQAHWEYFIIFSTKIITAIFFWRNVDLLRILWRVAFIYVRYSYFGTLRLSASGMLQLKKVFCAFTRYFYWGALRAFILDALLFL